MHPKALKRVDPVIERIEQELSKQGIPQLALCEYLGLARQTFTKWKNGESRSYYQRIAAIADYLDVSVSYLLDFEYEKVRSDRLTPMEREIIRRYRRLDEPMQDWLLTAIKLAGGEKRTKKQASKNRGGPLLSEETPTGN